MYDYDLSGGWRIMENKQQLRKSTISLISKTLRGIVEKEKRRIGKLVFIDFKKIEKDISGRCDCFKKVITFNTLLIKDLEDCKTLDEFQFKCCELFDTILHEIVHLWKWDFYETCDVLEDVPMNTSKDKIYLLVHGKLFRRYYKVLYDRYQSLIEGFYFTLKENYGWSENGN